MCCEEPEKERFVLRDRTLRFIFSEHFVLWIIYENGEDDDKEKFHQMACELKLMLYHEAESRLRVAMFYAD